MNKHKMVMLGDDLYCPDAIEHITASTGNNYALAIVMGERDVCLRRANAVTALHDLEQHGVISELQRLNMTKQMEEKK